MTGGSTCSDPEAHDGAVCAEHNPTRANLERAGFASYGEAREAAGFARGSMRIAYSDDELLAPLVVLLRTKKRWPIIGEFRAGHHTTAECPSHEAYLSAERREPLRERLLRWCGTEAQYSDIIAHLSSTASGRAARERTPARGAKVVTGQVYLMRYGTRGNDYKIGISDTVGRRESQLDMMSSSDVRKVHVIETGDPRGIEAYWHERFKDRRVNADSLILPRRANSSRAGYGRYVSCTDV